ncbi:MAG: SCO family protein [Kofleriaceae bacterium]|nr:SCO family protein [Kofleriaceae bacterium]
MNYPKFIVGLALASAFTGCDKRSAAPPQPGPATTATTPTAPGSAGSDAINGTAASGGAGASGGINGLSTDSIFQSKTVWEDQDGRTSALAKIGGKPLIVAMVFTQCQASCPIMMADLKAIEAELTAAELEQTSFAVFSFDAARETAATLRTFAENYHVDLNHWAFYHGDAAAVRELAAMLNVRFAELPQGGFDHANIITVIDGAGVQRFQQSGLGLGPREIVAHVRQLLKPPATP